MSTPDISREPCPDHILNDLGGAFAMGAIGLFSVFDCTAVYIRQKEDPWNSIISGAAISRLLQMRHGLGLGARSALFGGILLAYIEGVGIMLNRIMVIPPPSTEMEDPGMASMPPDLAAVAGAGGAGTGMYQMHAPPSLGVEESIGSWFGGIFGGKKKVKESGGAHKEVLESFDSSPVPTFDYK